MTEKEYWYWLCNIPEMWQAKISRLLDVFHTPRELYEASEALIRKLSGLPQKDIHAIVHSRQQDSPSGMRAADALSGLARHGIRFICLSDPEYPRRLLTLYDKPYGLYVRGHLPSDDLPSVAIVGARSCTNYGRQMTVRLAKSLAGHGVQTISGLARGIDSCCHTGTLAGGGETFGILGCGIDVCYPPENRDLFDDCASHGGVISEYPPGTRPIGWQFPHRNRLISGLADKVIVMEAREKSGSLITVDFALEQGKDVLALPGRVTDPCSRGCNRLIRQGAMILTDTEDIIAEFSGAPGKAAEGVSTGRGHTVPSKADSKADSNVLPEAAPVFERSEASAVFSHLDVMGKMLSVIVEETGLTTQEVMIGLFELQSKNLAAEGRDGYYKLI